MCIVQYILCLSRGFSIIMFSYIFRNAKKPKAKQMFNQREEYQSVTCKRQLHKLRLGDKRNLKIIQMIESLRKDTVARIF